MKTKLIFVNGWGFNHSIFDNLKNEIRGLIEIDYEEVFIDPTIISSEDLRGDAFSMLRDQSDKFVICWSLGTPFFIENLSSFINVKGLVLISGTLCFINSDKYKLGWDHKILQRMYKKLNICASQVMKDFIRNSSSGFCSYYHYEHIKNSVIKFDSETLPKMGLRLMELAENSANYFSLIESNDYSTLEPMIIHGESDNIVDIRNSIYMYKLFPNSKLIILENCGHVPHVTHCKHVSCLVYNYFKEMEHNNDR